MLKGNSMYSESFLSIPLGVKKNMYCAVMICLLSIGLRLGPTFADTITAVATGSPTPSTTVGPVGASVTNGDFLITQAAGTGTIGDGLDERTTWVLDFTTDPNFLPLPSSAAFNSATLLLTLEPKGGDISTDIIKIEGLSNITMSSIGQAFPVSVTTTLQIELLDFYTSSDILNVLNAAPDGQLPLLYADDAIISYAELVLSGNTEFAPTLTHSVTHTFSIQDVQGGFDGSTVGDAGAVHDPSIVCGAPVDGSPSCPADAAQPVVDKDGTPLYPVDSEFGFYVVDFLGASSKVRDNDYGEGWVGDIVENGVHLGLKVSNAATDFYKVKPPLGTWCAGLGGTAVKCSTEHYTVMEHVLSCHEVIPYLFADPLDGSQSTLSFPDGTGSFDCAQAELDDQLMILQNGVPGALLTEPTPGVQMEANDNTTVLNDIAVSRDYSVTLKDDGKPLYRWGGLIKRPNDVRIYARLALPQEWKDNPGTAYPVKKARLVIEHWVTNNPNDQLRPEDMENEGATGRKPSYRVENAGTADEIWKSTKACFEGDGDFIDIEGSGDPTLISEGTFFKNGPFAITTGDNPSPLSSDLIGGLTNGWYTSIDRDPFEWSYRVDTGDPNMFEFVGSALSDETLGELVSGPRWRLRANKYGQDIPGLEIIKDPPADSPLECLPPPPSKDDIKYEVGTPTTTEIDLLDFDDVNGDGIANDSPLMTSQGWIDVNGNGVNIPAVPGLSINGLPLTEDFDLAVYIKGDRKPTAIFSARLIIDYEGIGN